MKPLLVTICAKTIADVYLLVPRYSKGRVVVNALLGVVKYLYIIDGQVDRVLAFSTKRMKNQAFNYCEY